MEYRRGTSRPAPSTMLVAILSGFERRGCWNIPGRMTTFTLFGGGVVDLRYADFTASEVEIHRLFDLRRADHSAAARVNVRVGAAG